MDSTIRRRNNDEGEELQSPHEQMMMMDVGLTKEKKTPHQECIPFIGSAATSVPPAATAAAPTAPTTTTRRAGSKTRLLSPFAVPSKRFYGNRTRLVHGRVSVVVDADNNKFLLGNNTKIYFDLQDKHDDGLRFPILMAVKQWKNRKYDIYDISWDDDDKDADGSNKKSNTATCGDQQDANSNSNSNNKVGTLEKMLSFHVGKICYKLCNDSGAEETRISYRLHNPIAMDNKVTPGRQCDLVLMTDEGKKNHLTSNDIVDELKKKKAKDDNSSSNDRTSNDSEQQPKLLHHLFSKIPDTCNADNQFVLDFKGRGRQTSTKNAQLVDYAEQQGKVVLQMAKVETGIFHVDYREPCTAFHAFAYALAQLDL